MTTSTAIACPRCNGESELFRHSPYKGDIFKCKTCLIPHPTKEEKMPLLWTWQSDRLWEDLGEPEGIKKPELVKVILGTDPEKLV